MSVRNSIACGVVLAFVATTSVVLLSFVWRVSFNLPGVLEISSSPAEPLRTELQLNPLAPLLVAVVVAAVLWLLGRARGRKKA
jgi:hypothetical protein